MKLYKKVLSIIFVITIIIMSLSSCKSDANKLRIVIKEGSNSAVAEIVQNAIKEQWGQDVSIVTDKEGKYSGREILVGNTNRDASVKLTDVLRANDFAITFSDKFIAINGGTDDDIKSAAEYFAKTYLNYYEDAQIFPSTKDADFYRYGNYSIDSVKFNNNTINKYVIVSKDGNQNETASYLQEQLKKIIGYNLDIISPNDVKSEQVSIILGSSGYKKASEQVAKLSEGEQYLYYDENDLYICGKNSEDEKNAAKILVLNCLNPNKATVKNKKKEIVLTDLNMKTTTKITAGDDYDALLEQVMKIPVYETFSVFQGGCTDGKYAYYVMNDQSIKPYTNCIYKVDLKTWKIVDKSERLSLEHANSIAFNSKINRIIVSNYEPTYNGITYVNPDTLEVDKKATVDYNTLNIAYSSTYNRYAIGLKDTYNFVITDDNFKVIKFCEGIDTKSIKQEVDCDDDYIYFVESDSNCIIVHDWDGNYVTTINLGLFVEAENIIHVNNKIYTGFFSSGGLVYETIPYRVIK